MRCDGTGDGVRNGPVFFVLSMIRFGVEAVCVSCDFIVVVVHLGPNTAAVLLLLPLLVVVLLLLLLLCARALCFGNVADRVGSSCLRVV